MKIHFFLIPALFVLASCQDEATNVGEFENIPNPNAKEDILEVLRSQQDSWNQGDINGFMNYYLNNEELTFAGSNGITKGHEQVLKRYLNTYDTADKMGTLKFNVLEFRQISPTSAYLIGEWALQRTADNPSGYFTLVWEKVNGEWKIIHDHTS